MSSDATPLDSRNATLFSRGASRIVGSSRKREACSSSPTLSGSPTSLSVGVGASTTGVDLCSDCGADIGCDSSAAGNEGEESGEVCCHEGILGLFDMSKEQNVYWTDVAEGASIDSALLRTKMLRRMAGPRQKLPHAPSPFEVRVSVLHVHHRLRSSGFNITATATFE
jgi:hypothetical protein